MKNLLIAILLTVALSACSSVKEYQKSKINDADMELSAKKSERFESNFLMYREGGSGANGGKTGGGCGCN